MSIGLKTGMHRYDREDDEGSDVFPLASHHRGVRGPVRANHSLKLWPLLAWRGVHPIFRGSAVHVCHCSRAVYWGATLPGHC